MHCQVQRNPRQASLSTYGSSQHFWTSPHGVAKDESTLNLSNPGASFSFLYKPAIQPVNSLGSALLSVLSFSFSRLTLLLPHLRVPVQSGLCQMLLTVLSLTSAIKNLLLNHGVVMSSFSLTAPCTELPTRSSLVAVTVRKHSPKSNSWEERVYFTHTSSHSPSWRDTGTGSSRQELKQRPPEERCLLMSLPALTQRPFAQSPALLARDGWTRLHQLATLTGGRL